MKITMEDIKKAKHKINGIREEYDKLSLKEQVYTKEGISLGNSLNRAIKTHKNIKGSFFFGNN